MVLAPFIVLLVAWALAAKAELAGSAVHSLLCAAPYIVAILALFMSVWYQNSNSFYLVCFILTIYAFISASALKYPMLNEVVTFSSILLPINAILLGFSKERGIISSYGRNKAIIIIAQLIWIFINMMGKSGADATKAPQPILIGLKAPALVLYIIAIVVLLVSYFLKSQYLNIAFVAVLIASIISFYLSNRIIVVAIFTTAIFVIIVIALFDISYSLAFYDTLTGVLSRRALEQELLKLGNKYCIAMVDLDHFKHINDNYGHDVGDEVLKMVASLLEKTAGRAKVFRYGGEEFAILFSGIGISDATAQLERMRKIIERRPFIIRSMNRPSEKPQKITASSTGQGKINVTVSIGVAQKSELLKTWQEVIRKADEALYKSKNGGRNCVTRV